MSTATPILKVPAPAITPDGNPTERPAVTPPVGPPPPEVKQPVETPAPKSIEDLPKVDEGKPTTPETKVIPELDLTDFLKAKGEELPKEEPKKEEVKKEESAKPVVPPLEVKKEDEKVTRKDLVEQDKKTRDVSDITDPTLSNLLVDEMSRAAFDRVKPIIAEHVKTKAELAELKKDPLHSSYYEHPQSFVLTPEFQESLVEYQEQQRFLNTLKQQEMAVIEGKDSFNYPVFNQLTNQYEMKAFQNTAQNAAQLRNNIVQLEKGVVEAQTKMKVIEQTHLNKVQQNAAALLQKEQAWFGQLDKPEHKLIFDPMIKAVLTEFPAQYHNSPLMPILLKSLVMNQTLKDMLDKATKTATPTVQTPGAQPVIPRPQLQPTQGEVTGAALGPKTNGKEDISMEDFLAVKEGRA